MRWVVLTVLYLALTACKLVPADKHAELKDISSELDESGVSINVALHDDMADKNCFSGPNPHKSLFFKGEKYKEEYNITANLEKCKIIVTKTAQNGKKHSIDGHMGMVKDAVQYFCPNEDLCPAAYDALGNFLEFIFLTSKHMSGSEIAKESKKQLEQLYNAPLIQLDAMPKDSGELIKNYPPRKGKDVPMQAYLIRIYAYLNSLIKDVIDTSLDIHFYCDKCWKNVEYINNNKGNLGKTVTARVQCVSFKKDGRNVRALLTSRTTPVSISQDTGSSETRKKVDKEISLTCSPEAVPHIFLTCEVKVVVGVRGTTRRKYRQKCSSMDWAIGTMPITKEHRGKTICARLPQRYNLNMFPPALNKMRIPVINFNAGDYSFADEVVTFRTIDNDKCNSEEELKISIKPMAN